MRKRIRIFFAPAFLCVAVSAQTVTWQPSQGHKQLPIWPKKPPDAQPGLGREEMKTVKDPLIDGGKPWAEVDHVSTPTLTVYSPQGQNTGVAVVVFPGGGYKVLAIDLQGTEICDWLTSKGITCVLLKYRVPGLAFYAKPAFPFAGPYPESPI